MKKIVIFGNCQATQLKMFLSKLLPSSEFQVSDFSNNTRTGNMKLNKEILCEIENCDILIYQPLSDSHGDLSQKNIKRITKSNCILISFPYIFNSGVYSLCHAPHIKNRNSYGYIFGEDIILNLLLSSNSKEKIINDYRQGKIDFNLKERFNKCIYEMKRREFSLSIDIKLSEFIEKNYQRKKLFITHNHPSNIVFYEMIRQIINIIPLPINQLKITKLTIPDLGETNCPITPYDIITHAYEFDSHKDWFVKGTSLIELIVDNYLMNQGSQADAKNLV